MDNPARVASCNICLLSKAMRKCESCAFNPASLELKRDELLQVQRVELLTQSQIREKENK